MCLDLLDRPLARSLARLLDVTELGTGRCGGEVRGRDVEDNFACFRRLNHELRYHGFGLGESTGNEPGTESDKELGMGPGNEPGLESGVESGVESGIELDRESVVERGNEPGSSGVKFVILVQSTVGVFTITESVRLCRANAVIYTGLSSLMYLQLGSIK